MADTRGNLLVIGAVVLAVLLVATTAVVTTVESEERHERVSESDNVDLLQQGVAAELSNASATAVNDSANATTPVRVSARSNGTVGPARRAVRRAFDGSLSPGTERRIAGLLETVADRQGRTGTMTAIEPTAAGVDVGVSVSLGSVVGDSDDSNSTVTDVIQSVSREQQTYTQTAVERPGPNWTRGDQRGTTSVVAATEVASDDPGPNWTRTEVIERQPAAYQYTRNVSRPGPSWERVGPNGTTELITDRRVGTERPGQNWTVISTVAQRNAVYDRVVNATRPGPTWVRLDRAGSTTIVRNATTAAAPPGPRWTRPGVANDSYSRYRYTTARQSPGPEWIRLNRTGTTTVVRNRTTATVAPGPGWEQQAIRSETDPVYDTVEATTAPGPNWTRMERVDTRSVVETTTAPERPGPEWERTGESETGDVYTVSSARPGPGWTDVGQTGVTRHLTGYEQRWATSDPGRRWEETGTTRRVTRASTNWNWRRLGPGRNLTDGVRLVRDASHLDVVDLFRHNVSEHNGTVTQHEYQRLTGEGKPLFEWHRPVGDATAATYRLTEERPVYRYRTVVRPARTVSLYERTEEVPVYRYRTQVSSNTASRHYVRTETVPTYTWQTTVRENRTVRQFGRVERVQTYDWRRLDQSGYVLAVYERRVDRPAFEWTKTVNRTVTELTEVELDAESLASADGPQQLLTGANGTRNSSLTVVANSLPIGRADATVLAATRSGAVGSARSWQLSLYREPNGTAVVAAGDRRVRADGSTVTVSLDDLTVDGTRLGVAPPDEVYDRPFDLTLTNGSGVYGSYSLFATNPAGSGMRPVENVTVERAIDTATFDVTYQDSRTTYTDTVTVRPDHAPLGGVTVERPGDPNATNTPPAAQFILSRVNTNVTHATIQFDATGSADDGAIDTYDWSVLSHSDRVSGLYDNQISQTITVERTTNAYYLPVELTVEDSADLTDIQQNGISIAAAPSESGPDPLTPQVDIGITNTNNTHAWVRADLTNYTDLSRYSYDWSVASGAANVVDRSLSSDRRTAFYILERTDSPYTVAVNSTVTETTTGTVGSTIVDTTIPRINGSGTNDFRVSATPLYQDSTTAAYRLDATGAEGPPINWAARSNADRVTGLSDGTASQSITLDKVSTEYDLTIQGTDVRDGEDDPTDAVTLTVPAKDTDNGGPDLTADIQSQRIKASSDTVTWQFDSRGSRPARLISSTQWSVDDYTSAVNATTGGDRTFSLAVDRPDSGSITVPVSLTVGTADGNTDTTETTVTVSPTGGTGPVVSNHAPNASLELAALPYSEAGEYKYQLDASGSTDRDGDSLSYDYNVTTSGGTVVDAPGGGAETNVVVDFSGVASRGLNIQVTVSDGTLTDSVRRFAYPTAPQDRNNAPRAVLQTTPLPGGNGTVQRFQLDARNTTDPDSNDSPTLNYEVTVENGELLDPLDDTKRVQDVSVRVVDDDPDVKINLTASDGQKTDSDTVALIGDPVSPDPPQITDIAVEPQLPLVGENTLIGVSASLNPATIDVFVDGDRQQTVPPVAIFGNMDVVSAHTFESSGQHNVTAVARANGQTGSRTRLVDVNTGPEFTTAEEITVGTERTGACNGDGCWVATIRADALDANGDQYTLSAAGAMGAQYCYNPMIGNLYCEDTPASGSNGQWTAPASLSKDTVDQVYVKMALNESTAPAAGLHDVRLTLTDEHGATTDKSLTVGEEPTGGVSDSVSIEAHGPTGTVTLEEGESVNFYGSYSINGEDAGTYPGTNTRVSVQRDGYTIDTTDGTVSQPGTYLVTVTREWDYSSSTGDPTQTATDTLSFQVERPSEQPSHVETRWSATQPGPAWDSTENTRMNEAVVDSQWITLGVGNQVRRMARMVAEGWSKAGRQTSTQWATTDPGPGWTQTGDSRTNNMDQTQQSVMVPEDPDCPNCAWVETDDGGGRYEPSTWRVRQTQHEWEQTEVHLQQTEMVEQTRWMLVSHDPDTG